MARSSSNMNSASARASSVLPTPVGPRKTNEPIGRFGSCRPGARAPERVRDGLDGLVLADDALVQPLLHVDRASRSRPRAAATTGMPVQRATTSAMSSSSTSSLTIGSSAGSRRARRAPSRARAARRSGSRPRAARSPCALGALGLHAQLVDPLRDLLDAVERLLLLRPAGGELVAALLRLGELALDRLAHLRRTPSPIAASSISSWRTRRSASSSSSGDESISIRSRDAASSTRSIALSGRKRSVM